MKLLVKFQVLIIVYYIKIRWWLKGRCVRCGHKKIDWRGVNVCPKHGLFRFVYPNGYPPMPLSPPKIK